MGAKTVERLTPRQRLTRGLKYTAAGPVDVARGGVGLGVAGAQSSAAWVAQRYRDSRLKAQLAEELAVAQGVVAGLPAAVGKAGKTASRRRRHPLLYAAAGLGVLAAGAVTFSIVRRSMKPEPSPLPPSVEVSPRP